MPDNPKLIPVFGPALNLLRSRKFLVAVLTLVIDVVVAYVPELEAVRAELLTIFTLVGSLLIASIAYEDGNAIASGGSSGRRTFTKTE